MIMVYPIDVLEVLIYVRHCAIRMHYLTPVSYFPSKRNKSCAYSGNYLEAGLAIFLMYKSRYFSGDKNNKNDTRTCARITSNRLPTKDGNRIEHIE